MSRKIALPLLVAAALVSIILASRTPQPIIEELPPEEADAPTALLTQTEEVGDQTVTLRVYEPDEAGYARYALFGADGAEIDIPFGVNRGTWIGNGNAAEKVSLTARDDVLGFPGFELETIQGIVMTVCDFYALTEQGFVYAGRTVGYDFDDAAEGDGAWPLDLTGDGRSELITRSTFGDGMSCVFVYRWNAAEGGSQRSEVDWDKADAQLARLSAPLGVTARAETYHAQDNTVTLTLYHPSQYPEENPLLEKGSRFAFHKDDLYDYYYGLANPREVLNDDWYVYRGVDEESALSEGQGYEVHLGTSPLYHYQG